MTKLLFILIFSLLLSGCVTRQGRDFLLESKYDNGLVCAYPIHK